MCDKILVTPRSITQEGGHWALSKLEESGFQVIFSTPGVQPSEQELMELLPGCVGYLAGVEPITGKVLEEAKNLKVLSRNGVGTDNIDMTSASRLKIKVCKTEGANARGVAELAISLIFSMVRSIPYSNSLLSQGYWKRKIGIELKDRKLGIVGCGRIGQEVALLALGLGMKVLAYDAFSQPTFTDSSEFEYVGFDDLLKRADVISFHCPPIKGEVLIGSNEIAKMKEGVYLVNTARAELIDESEILNQLNSGKISGFATDVYRKEPPENFDLLKHDNVICTAHVGGFTKESVDRAVEGAVDNILANILSTV
jgi:D-3-phosphoglycerate dehydrogenase